MLNHLNREKWEEIIFGSDTKPGKRFDEILLWLISLSILIIMLDSVEGIRQKHGSLLYIAEWAFTIIFTFEYFIRIYVSKKPLSYIFSFFGLVDLLSILPTYLALILTGAQYMAIIRVLRILRMFRILKMMRHVSEANIILRALIASRHKITVFFSAVAAGMIVMGTIMYLVEGNDSGFTSIPKSIYWAVVTFTTVGYGDISPQTTLGQFLSAFAMLCGYAMLAVPTGIVGVEIYNDIKHLGNVTCKACGTQDHSPDSSYCKHCGAELDA